MEIKRVEEKVYEDDRKHKVSIISPLEEVGRNHSTNYQNEAIPSEQGELLLEFIRKHLFKTE